MLEDASLLRDIQKLTACHALQAQCMTSRKVVLHDMSEM
jgi:hypothetical protein